jgi:hypothetical protein
MQRPGRIYLVIQFSFVDLVEMASDGEHFAVAVFQGDEKYKRFVRGTNSAVYQKLDAESPPTKTKNGKKSEKKTVSALSNLRPQHLTDALMIRPSGNNYRQTSTHKRVLSGGTRYASGREKESRVLRGYIYSRSYPRLRTTRRACSGVSGSTRCEWYQASTDTNIRRSWTPVTRCFLLQRDNVWRGCHCLITFASCTHASSRSIQAEHQLPGAYFCST